MAKLADLFNERSQDIYKRFTPSSTQPVRIRPDTEGVFGSKSRIKDDTRAVPTVSVLRDTKRVSSFLTSPQGLLFLGTQALLQTGNTFVNTRIYNPLSPLLNTVPFIHIRRNKKVSVGIPGLLQNPTVSKLNEKIGGERVGIGLLSQLKGAVTATPQLYRTSRPEYYFVKNTYSASDTGPRLFAVDPLTVRDTRRIGIKQLSVDENQGFPTDFVTAADSFKQKFYDNILKKFEGDTTNNRLKSKYFDESSNGITESDQSTQLVSAISTRTTLRDPYNKAKLVSSKKPDDTTVDYQKINYQNIIQDQKRNSDIIKFIFREVSNENPNPIHFRALISSIKESIKPEFNEQRYVGRTERFVTYGGSKRTLNLMFNIVAFSNNELEGMWSRINYLSGLTFPKKIENGFMVPPLFKFTLGELYENQPCYIESLDYDFLDETITFDINNEVPFAINVTMQLSILEKRSKFFDSPFYKITEEIADLQAGLISDEQARALDEQIQKDVALPDNLVPNTTTDTLDAAILSVTGELDSIRINPASAGLSGVTSGRTPRSPGRLTIPPLFPE